MSTSAFSYDAAFARNIGWVTKEEQTIFRNSRIAIAGMGGVGGSHLMTLTRLGIGAFNIADFDHFELPNFNRQAGAKLSSLGKAKTETLAAMARDINPDIHLNIFEHGVQPHSIDDFLKDVDIYIDGLDFFVLDMRRKIFEKCHQLKIPAITAAPAGMGTAFLVFKPDGMSFEEYFQMEGHTKTSQMVRFLLGLAPAGLHRSYLMDKQCFDIVNERVPSTGLSCELCAGVAAAQVTKLLLGRGTIYAAPWYEHFDAYNCQWVRRRLRRGNKGIIQRIKIALAERHFSQLASHSNSK
ncbi:ThiF family adenylyltransferase [Pseudomonas plecoglossicida]|uniref:ThiF family adenylyltransferase n=1 Tax=Pseudomonas plecoglossicida TaxID=70775 RepID=UPI003D1D9779